MTDINLKDLADSLTDELSSYAYNQFSLNVFDDKMRVHVTGHPEKGLDIDVGKEGKIVLRVPQGDYDDSYSISRQVDAWLLASEIFSIRQDVIDRHKGKQ